MTHYLWRSESLENSLQQIIDDNGGPIMDHFGYPLITNKNAALTEAGRVVLYTAETLTPARPAGRIADYTLVGAFAQATALYTIEGITDAGRDLAKARGFEPTIKAITALAAPAP